MRLPARRIAASALCAGLALGVTAPVAMAADSGTVRERAASQAPLPAADELRDQAKDLGLIGSVLSPVADLIEAVIGSGSGQLSQAQADQHAQAVREAIARANASDTAAEPNANTPARPPATTPNGTAKGADAPTTLPARSDAAPAADLAARATSGLQKQVDALLKASVAGNAEQIRPAADKVVTGAVNVVAAGLAAGRLPAPDLAGLPQATGENARQDSAAAANEAQARRD